MGAAGVEAADDQGGDAADQGLVADFHVELGGRRLGAQGRGEQLHRLAVAGGDLAARGERLDQEAAGDGRVAGEDVEQGGEAGAHPVGPGLPRPRRRQHRVEDVGLDHLVGGDEAVLLALEVLVEGAAGDLRRGGDTGDRGRVVAVLGDRLDHAVEQPLALVLGDEDARQAVAAGRQPLAGPEPSAPRSPSCAAVTATRRRGTGRGRCRSVAGRAPPAPRRRLSRGARAGARRGRRRSPPRGSRGRSAGRCRGRGPRAASPRPGRAPPRSGRSAPGRRSAPRPGRAAPAPARRRSAPSAPRRPVAICSGQVSSAGAAARASSVRRRLDRPVEGGDEALFLALEELVEGDRGDAGLLDDRFDRGAGAAVLGDQPLGRVEDPLALRRRKGVPAAPPPRLGDGLEASLCERYCMSRG